MRGRAVASLGETQSNVGQVQESPPRLLVSIIPAGSTVVRESTSIGLPDFYWTEASNVVGVAFVH